MALVHACGTRMQRDFLRRAAVCLMVLALLVPYMPLLAATEHHGQVTFGGLPVPGATVTATRGDKKIVAITDQQGVYSFADLDDGMWQFQVEMAGFAMQTQDITIGTDTPSTVWELKLLPFEEITRGLVPANAESANNGIAPAAGSPASGAAPPASPAGSLATAPTAPKQGGFQTANVNASAGAPAPTAAAPPSDTSPVGDATTAGDLNQRAAQGLLVNGSENNGAASPFAQLAAFGNNRSGGKWLYNGSAGAIFDTSSWDAAPFSVTGLSLSKPAYNDVQFVGTFGGPIGIPHHVLSNSNFFVAYQHASNDSAVTTPGLVPTMLERAGNFSQTFDAQGQPVQIYNPATGMPFSGNMVPVNAQAMALLALYPMPNANSAQGYNYEASVLSGTHNDSVQSRFSKTINSKNQLFGGLAYSRTVSETTNLFGFQDTSDISGIDLTANWQHRVSATFYIHFKYEFSRLATDVTPFFASNTNVSGVAGIMGNNQDPTNWGPPSLIFSSGVSGLSDAQYAHNSNLTNAWSFDTTWYHRRHNISFGGDFRLLQFNILSQQDPRGTVAFTGAATQQVVSGVPAPGTGSDLADFILGIPDTSSIAFGNADKDLRGRSYDVFLNDDIRVSSGFTLNAGLRWEYAAPFTELHDRLVNLDLPPSFSVAAPVLASDPVGSVTGQRYPSSLLYPDRRGFEPRIGIAWRPIPASPLVIRAGYGISDNTGVYQLLAMQLAQQPPLSKTFSVPNSAANPLTLANGFNTVPGSTPNTFAVDPNFRVGYAQNWQLSVQEDLPSSLTMTVTYTGIKGTRLMQESLPNTFPLGATNPCPACPAGFIYLSSNGNSTREAGQIQLRRRLRSGLTWTFQYTYSKSIDDASSFSGAGLGAGAIAQNWQDLRADRGLSTFDQRHLATLQLQYTSGEGLGGGALLSGWRGRAFKEWTFTTQITAGSGFPLTPVYFAAVTGTGVVGTIRPNYTGVPVGVAPPGFLLNPAAYTAPTPGQWGDAGRDSITGPAQFSLNASIGRVFRLNSRLNAQWTMSATNALNNVTYTSYNTTVTSPLFGLPSAANTMRKIQTTFRVRF